MATTNFKDNLTWLLLRSTMIAKHRLLKISEKHDLSFMQALTLCLLEPNVPVAMSSISGLLVCDPSNVTGIVERLTTGKLIERRESTTDRRVKTICLTDTGVKLREELLLNITDDDTANLLDLTDEEIADLKALLKKTLPDPSAKKLQHLVG